MSPSRIHWIILASLLAVVLAYLARHHRPYGLSGPAQPMAVGQIELADRRFTVEIATTPRQRQQGLQNRTTLAPGAGMLFVMPRVEPAEFWMKDTLIPLDMIFMDAAGHVVSRQLAAQPCRVNPCKVYSSGVSAKYVLELAAGQGNAIQVGAQAVLPPPATQ